MADFVVSGYIHMESTGDEAQYEYTIEDCEEFEANDPVFVLMHMIQTGEIQIIPTHWEQIEEIA